MIAAEALVRAGIQPEHDLIFAAVAQEETGLVGMKIIYDRYRDRAEAFIDVLGDGHSISYGALGIHWWRVAASGPGGHTLRGGLPNINQGIGRAVDRILSLPNATRDDSTRTRIPGRHAAPTSPRHLHEIITLTGRSSDLRRTER